MGRSIAAAVVIAICWINTALAEGFSGAICFRSGDCIEFQHLGEFESVQDPIIGGYLGPQYVKFRFSENADSLVTRVDLKNMEFVKDSHEGTLRLLAYRGRWDSFVPPPPWCARVGASVSVRSTLASAFLV